MAGWDGRWMNGETNNESNLSPTELNPAALTRAEFGIGMALDSKIVSEILV